MEVEGTDVVKLILQFLNEASLPETAAALSAESQVTLAAPAAPATVASVAATR